MLIFVFFLLTLHPICDAQELFKNGDFESHNYNGNWGCNSCTLTSSSQSYHGQSSVKVSHRQHNWAGLGQTVNVSPGHIYVYSAMIKLLNNSPGHTSDDIELEIAFTHNNGHVTYSTGSVSPYARADFGWIEIGFDYKIPGDVHKIYIYVQIQSTSVEYLVDSASFKELPQDNQWKSNANILINSVRKAPIRIHLNNQNHGNAHNIQYEVKQVKSKFAFGTAVNARMIADNTHHKYQEYFYNNFEYAVLENALKWNFVEGNEGRINMDTPMTAINAMRSRGITVRGHNMFWAVPGNGNIPTWLNGKSSSDLLHEMHKHINDVISRTRGTLVHWDVNNEKLHGNYFSQHTGNPDVTMDMFKWIHQTEPGVKLFLNEYDVASGHKMTSAYKVQAQRFVKAGVPIYGVGIQCHIGANFDINEVKYRLDKVAEAGLPIWITEFTVNDANENHKADQIENLLTLFLSNPSVEGVLFWGFWDGVIWLHDSALANGNEVTPNAAGRRYEQLFHNTWRTHVTTGLHNLVGFMGDYVLNVKNNGHTIHSQNFTLDGHSGVDVHVNI